MGTENSVRFNAGLICQHNRYIVTDGIDSMTRGTFQTAPITSQLDAHFANWADENIEEFLRDGQTIPPAQSTLAGLGQQWKLPTEISQGRKLLMRDFPARLCWERLQLAKPQ
jgi:hypothetical protein